MSWPQKNAIYMNLSRDMALMYGTITTILTALGVDTTDIDLADWMTDA